MIVCTYIYQETDGTRQMRRSVERAGHELAVVNTTTSPDNINQQLFQLYKRAAGGHIEFVYADAADSFFQAPVTRVPHDYILYSTEKACYPHPSYAEKHPPCKSPWRFLNGGGVCGPLKLMIEYYERYDLCRVGSKNGQAYLQECFFQALAEGFPVKLDTDCEIFQTLAFADPSEFRWSDDDDSQSLSGPLLLNKVTGSVPKVLHGNGLTDMRHIYERFKG